MDVKRKGMSEKDVLERLRNYMIFRRSLRERVLHLINQMQSYNFIPEITRVAEDMDLHASTVWKFMHTLRNRGIWFRGIIDVRRLGLVLRVYVIKKPGIGARILRFSLRDEVKLLPTGAYLTYYVPASVDEEMTEVIESTLPENMVDLGRYEHLVVGRPDLLEYYDLDARGIRPAWDDLIKKVLNGVPEVPVTEKPRRGRFDEIDMFILRELEADPFKSLKSIAAEINKEIGRRERISYIRVLRHYKSHIEARNVIAGVRAKIDSLFDLDSLYLIIEVRGDRTGMLRLINAFLKHPYFLEALATKDIEKALLTAIVPMGEVENLASSLMKLKEEGVIDEWAVHLGMRRGRKQYSVPYKIFSVTPDEVAAVYRAGGDIISNKIVESGEETTYSSLMI